MLDGLQLDPIAFTIPIGDGFGVYWYGIIITVGIALGAFWGAREIERRGHSSDEFFNGLLIAILSGYFFARLTYVLLDLAGDNAGLYRNAWDVINIRRGGANILGGFIGAVIVVMIYLRWRKLSIWNYADIVGPVILLAQGIGRWGNFINQELYGPPTDSSWGILINRAFRLSEHAGLPEDQRFHPTFLYESIWLLLGFVVLIMLNRRFRDQWQPGTLFGAFLLWWGAGRFFIEFFRPDQTTIGESAITYSMLLSIAFAVVGVLFILNRMGKLGGKTKKRRPSKPKPRRTAKE